MASKIFLQEIDGTLSIPVPKELAERLNFKDGDEVFMSEKENGVLVTKQDPKMLVYQLPY